jgi:hypothetical protein
MNIPEPEKFAACISRAEQLLSKTNQRIDELAAFDLFLAIYIVHLDFRYRGAPKTEDLDMRLVGAEAFAGNEIPVLDARKGQSVTLTNSLLEIRICESRSASPRNGFNSISPSPRFL